MEIIINIIVLIMILLAFIGAILWLFILGWFLFSTGRIIYYITKDSIRELNEFNRREK